MERLPALNAGEKNGGAKLTEQQVRDIHARAAKGESRLDLAVEFGVTPLTILNITRCRKWKHLNLAPVISNRGSSTHTAKLTEADIPTISRRLQEGESIGEVARAYKVGRTTISKIKRGMTWKHVPRPVVRVRAWE